MKFLLSFLLLLPGLLPARSELLSVRQDTPDPVRFGRIDFSLSIRETFEDPYRFQELHAEAAVRFPSGKTAVFPAFYQDGPSGGESHWQVRLSSSETGVHQAEFRVVKGTQVSGPAQTLTFRVGPSAKKGFLRADSPWTLRFDSGEPFRGIGENICWESRSFDDSRFFKSLHEDPRFNYEHLLGLLSANGGTFFRTWMCPWNLPLEWKEVSPDTKRYRTSSDRFNPDAIRRMDELVMLMEEKDVYVMLALDAHGNFMGGNWDRNPYNLKNGGPCRKPADFFTLSEARDRYKDRLRYLIARWGYSPSIAAWEFFNEIDNLMYDGNPADRIPDEVITAWHAEMSRFLKETDPYGHLVTTSISHRDVAGLNEIATLDLNQKHIYKNTPAIPGTIRNYLAAHQKPYVIGEFGYEWDWSKDFNSFADDMDRDFKRGLWLGLFSPTPVLPMSWWWEFFENRGLMTYFRQVRNLNDRMLAAGGGTFQEEPLTVYGGSGLAVRAGKKLFIYLWQDKPGAGSLSCSVQGNWNQCELTEPETGSSKAGRLVKELTSVRTEPVPAGINGDVLLILTD